MTNSLHAVVPLWSAERATVVGDNLLTLLPLLSKNRTKTYSAGVGVNNERSFGGLDSPVRGPQSVLPRA